MQSETSVERGAQALLGEAAPLDGSRFRVLADEIPALISSTAASGEVESVNARVLEYYGASLEQLRNWQKSNFVHPDELSEVIAAWQHSMVTGEPYDIEHRSRRFDGVYRWFHVRAQPLRDAEGQIVRWCYVHVDIDERKRAELVSLGEKKLLEMVASGVELSEVLKALCHLLGSVADGCCSGVLLLDRSHTRIKLAVAPALPDSYNRALEGLSVSLEHGPCGMAATLKKQVIVADVAAETRFDTEGWPALAREYGIRSCWSTPVLSRAGETLGTFAVYQRSPGVPSAHHNALMQQLTQVAAIAIERSRSEEALKRGQAVLAEAEVISATGSFSLEPTSGLHWWSDQTYRIFGVEPGTPLSLDLVRARCHPDDLDVMNQCLEYAQRGESHATELRLQLPDGTIKYVQLGGHAYVGTVDGSSEFVGAVRDVTERRQSEAALNKARSELAHAARVTSLGMLTASIAHELNQPLSGIMTNAGTGLRMLSGSTPNVDGALETTRRTLRDAQRAADVIARLRALFGGKTSTTEVLDLNQVAREVLALLRIELQQGRVVLRTQLAEPIHAIRGDRVQLQQVVLNLLQNAIAAMSGISERPRQLLVRTDNQADQVCLQVCDVGIGIDETRLEELFDAFYTTKSDGMGIGLSVSRAIIENHRGHLWACSNEGPGATFAFSIPIHL